MSRYIDVDAVLKIIGDNCPHDKCGYNTEEEMGAGAACYYIMKGVENIPTADVEEVRHGMWIKHKENCLEYRCSFCEYEHCRKVNYCPNCGAKMDGERSEI